MGADIYLNTDYQPNHEKYEPLFVAWARRRDAYHERGAENLANDAQKKVTEYYNKMFETGYFRDSYNESNLLWTMDLSWWGDVGDNLDEDTRTLPIDKAQWLLDELYARHDMIAQAVPEISAKAVEKGWDQGGQSWDVDTLTNYFQEKWEQLTTMLRRSIELGEPLECSV